MFRKLVPPTDEEDAIITTAALNDPDAQPLTDEQLANLRQYPLLDSKQERLD